jgi:hypothetical protein
MLFETGLLVGRAYALGHQQLADDRAVGELIALADGDTAALLAAQERIRSLATKRPATPEEERAVRLLGAALHPAAAIPAAAAVA